ncbi:MAG: efflux RND transporter permease subunit [Candidatus Acidiferrales bacterium]
MNISAPFIRRPVATTLLTAAIALAGAVAFRLLPVAPAPQIDYPTISVSAGLPGASPDIMASAVATPLERQFGRIASITEMTSTSTLGSTNITLQFDLNRDINGAARDVQAAINAARGYLPINLPSNPTWRKSNPSDAPIFILALTSNIYDRGHMYDAASTILLQKFSQIQGVGQVSVGGSSLPAVRVDVNPTQLNSYGFGMPDVANMLRAQNSNLAKGQISGDQTSADILANDQLLTADYYKPLVVGYHNGAAVKLSDVADVEESVQNIRNAGYANGEPCVLVVVSKAANANIIDTVQRIQQELPSLKASIPAGIDMRVVLDRTTTIKASVQEVERTLVIAICLVIFVVFIFLRNARATLIPSVAVPVSLIGTFGVMYLLHYSLDNLSLMALTISTGFVVDDAIVVIENITRYIEQGMPPREAALRGAREIGFTVLSISLSLIAVFIPILLMSGILGRLFREFAVTLSVAILISLAVSLTTTPMMCSRLLRHEKPEGHGRLYNASERGFQWIVGTYDRTLVWVLDRSLLTLGVFLATIALFFYLFHVIPGGFFPVQDNGTIFGQIIGEQDISFQAMQKIVLHVVELIKPDPAIENVMAFTGGGNSGFVYIGLKPLSERKISSSNVINRLRPKLMSIPGASAILQPGQDIRGQGGRAAAALYQYTIQSENTQDLVKWGPILLNGMKKLPGFTDVNSDQQNGGLQARLVYDRDTASRLGITPQLIDSTLYDGFGQTLASTMYTSLNQYYVVLEVAPQFWQSPQGLNDVYVKTAAGKEVPLSAIAHFETATAPLQVNHQGQFPCVTVSFNLANGVPLSNAATEIDQMEQGLGLPPTVHGIFAGTLQSYQASISSALILAITAVFAVYIVLGILYESLIHPITILSTLPSAGVGALLALMLFHIDLNVMAMIGLVLLIGIVKKNGILMIDFAIAAERNEGKSPRDAIHEACLLRFRPILMTTMAAMFGALPLILLTGIGSELRRPLGVAIVFGLLVSQMLTLFTTPVVYLYMDRFSLWLRRSHKKGLSAAPQESSV